MKCDKCKAELSLLSDLCPECGKLVVKNTSKSKTWWYVGFATIVILFASVSYMLFEIAAAKQPPIAAEQNIIAKDKPPYDIGLTLDGFKERWNARDRSEVKRNLVIRDMLSEKRDGWDFYGYMFDPTLTIVFTVNKVDNSLNGVQIFGIPTVDENRNSNIFCSLLLLTMTVNPELDEGQRRALIVKLLGTSDDRSQLNRMARCGNNVYMAQFVQGQGYRFMVYNVLEYQNPDSAKPTRMSSMAA